MEYVPLSRRVKVDEGWQLGAISARNFWSSFQLPLGSVADVHCSCVPGSMAPTLKPTTATLVRRRL